MFRNTTSTFRKGQLHWFHPYPTCDPWSPAWLLGWSDTGKMAAPKPQVRSKRVQSCRVVVCSCAHPVTMKSLPLHSTITIFYHDKSNFLRSWCIVQWLRMKLWSQLHLPPVSPPRSPTSRHDIAWSESKVRQGQQHISGEIRLKCPIPMRFHEVSWGFCKSFGSFSWFYAKKLADLAKRKR